VLVAAFAVLAQTTLVRLLAVRDVSPDLLVAVTVAFSLGASPAGGFAVGAVVGLGRDLFSIGPLGLGTGLFALLGCAVALRRPGAFAGHFAVQAFFGLVCAAVVSGAEVLVLAAQGEPPGLRLAATHTAVYALSTALLSGLVGAAVWHWARWFGLRRRSEFE